MRTTAIIGNNFTESMLIKNTLTKMNASNKVSILSADEMNHACSNSSHDVIIFQSDVNTNQLMHQYAAALENKLLIKMYHLKEIEAQTQTEHTFFGYLPKPLTTERVVALYNHIDSYCKSNLSAQHHQRDYVFIKSDYKLVKVNYADILYIAGMKDYTQVYLKNKTNPLVTLQNLRDFESKLPAEAFVRVHKSYIVSMKEVDVISRSEIMIGKHSIPIGEAFKAGLQQVIALSS